MITKDQVRKVGSLAFLHIEEVRVDRLTENLNSILGYVQRLEKIDVMAAEPMSHVHGSTNVFRADEVTPSLPVEEALRNAPDTLGRFIRVPIIIGSSEN
ncbi:MAG: Glutamyl-tRNA(Gln) amidotransferase subunit [Pseudomonadota bacterium]|jgi:aspartyl-tRNA(Asn)/glutamyl-tRNA(Gln) amidotransferase subunit C